MPQLTIDLGLLGLPITDGDGWVQAVDSLGNPIPIAATNTGTLVFGSRALDFNTAGVATITLPATDDLEPAGVRYLVFITRADTVTQPVAIGPFVFTVDASLDAVAELPPADLVAAFNAVVTAAQGVLDAIGPIEPLAAQVSGYTDHGDISGAVTFTGPTGSHWFTATGPTTITLDGYAEPDVVTLICFGGAADVAVNGLPDLALADGTAWTAQRARGVWVTGGGTGAPATPDATPPTAVTGLDATGGSRQVTATWSAATDAESSVSYRWRVWPTSGGAAGDWTSTTATSFTKSGLASGDYTVEVYAYSHGGASATATDTATVTAPLVVDFLDTFTRANGSLSAAPTPNTGGNWAGSTAAPTITSGALVGTGETIYATRGSNPAREASCTVTTTATSDVRFTAWSTADDLAGPRAALLPSGQVSFQGVTNGSVTFNASGGTNYYTPTGYLADGVHVVKVISNPDGTCHLVIDGATVISAAYDNTSTGRHFGISAYGTVDDIEVKA